MARERLRFKQVTLCVFDWLIFIEGYAQLTQGFTAYGQISYVSIIPRIFTADEFKEIFGNTIDIKNLIDLPDLCKSLIKKNDISTELIESFEKKLKENKPWVFND